ncbi:ABC-three component system protein [Pseudoxanthomonas mexicana]|uniref:ABC-three component system protein n=1 Tax=Pseudoxanthomonas mexicana TaxID=128785 RepID=UPI0028AE5C4E|nr:ABC-three component system protein [Pseudoxanthomonas mexicana]
MATNYHRQILVLPPDDLERFARDWAASGPVVYHKVERFSGSGDKGRDVVGFYSAQLHEGGWDNYQCKQYTTTLPTAKAFHEIGKILFYSHEGEFTAPESYKFVAPKGVNRNLEKLLYKPAAFKQAFLKGWDEYCKDSIVEGSSIALTPSLRSFIEGYDFARIGRVNLDDMVDASGANAVLYKWFGADPGPAPAGVMPTSVLSSEMLYLSQLIDAYVERGKASISDCETALAHPHFGAHLARQRERFFDADAFKRFYRDNTDPEVIEAFESDILHGVIDVCEGSHADSLSRIDAVMAQAASVQPSGVLANHSRVKAKQGICHHFANEEVPRLRWKKP